MRDMLHQPKILRIRFLIFSKTYYQPTTPMLESQSSLSQSLQLHQNPIPQFLFNTLTQQALLSSLKRKPRIESSFMMTLKKRESKRSWRTTLMRKKMKSVSRISLSVSKRFMRRKKRGLSRLGMREATQETVV